MTKYENKIFVLTIEENAIKELNEFVGALGEQGFMALHLHEFSNAGRLSFMIMASRQIQEN